MDMSKRKSCNVTLYLIKLVCKKRQKMLKTKAQTADVSLILTKRSFNVV